jgi:alpha-tubulin suppressor-like RCC1 family protein
MKKILIFALGLSTITLTAGVKLIAWGKDNDLGEIEIPRESSEFKYIDAGGVHNLAVLKDDSVYAWGCNKISSYFYHAQTKVPSGLSNIEKVYAGQLFSIAIDKSGRATAWGNQKNGLTRVPYAKFQQIETGWEHNVGLTKEGKVVAWGNDRLGRYTGSMVGGFDFDRSLGGGKPKPRPYSGNEAIDVALGKFFTMALDKNGKVYVWGYNKTLLQAKTGVLDVPSDLKDVVDIAGTGNICLALKKNGEVVSWGQINSYDTFRLPKSMTTGVKKIKVNSTSSNFMVLKNDGSIAAYYYDYRNKRGEPKISAVPKFEGKVIDFSPGNSHCLILVESEGDDSDKSKKKNDGF